MNRNFPKLLAGFLLLISMAAVGQSPADWWYFGGLVGMHFTISGPVAVSDGQVNSSEGCAAISDKMGNLLFYTDGDSVWNKNHVAMPDGYGLLGDYSSTQSAVIVPRPGFPKQYYIFTVDDAVGPDGLCYTSVDMTLDNGLGNVVASEKNIPLLSSTAEKISCIPKPDGYWVITLKIPGDTAYAFEVTSAGVNTTPVLSNTGVNLTATNFFGYLKASVQGDRIAFVAQEIDDAYVLDFDANTGLLSNTILITQTNGAGSYGVEFSPDGNILYVQGYSTCDVRQYDLTLGTAAAISSSEFVLGSLGGGGGALQIGPDQKLYISRWNKPFLSRVEYPNVYGSASGFQDTALAFPLGGCFFGLPTFIQSFLAVTIEATGFCFSGPTLFSVDTTGIDSVLWNFGDPASGSGNTSVAFFPSHTFTDTGYFMITLVSYQGGDTDTAYKAIYIYPQPTLDFGDDPVLCNGDSMVFNISQPFASFLWQDGSTADTMLVTSDSLIKVTVYGVCDTLTDSVQVTFDFPVAFDLGPDTMLCEGQTYLIDADLQVNADVLWNTNDTTDAIAVSTPGIYVMTATNPCNTATDSVNVSFKPLPPDSLLPDDTLQCFDSPVILTRPQLADVNFVWSDSSTVKNYTVDTTETVWLTAFNECGFSVDTVKVVFNGEIKSELGEDTVICPVDSIVLHATWPGVSYLWNTGDTTDTIWTVDKDMTYLVTVTKGGCEKRLSIRVELNDLACPDIDCRLHHANVFTPNGDGVNDLFHAWSDCDIQSFDLSIYNRWGQLVHYSRNAAFGWDGYINGVMAPQGVYYFRIEFRDQVVVDADRHAYQGSVTLMR